MSEQKRRHRDPCPLGPFDVKDEGHRGDAVAYIRNRSR
jgi:hypothetical protein